MFEHCIFDFRKYKIHSAGDLQRVFAFISIDQTLVCILQVLYHLFY
jgi:hypothetical protein